LLILPFTVNEFDFSDGSYFNDIYSYMDYVGNLKEVRESKVARGSRHSIYINRTFFGLYSILNDLGAKIDTQQYKKYVKRV
jgi:hypothetical protein